MLVHSYLERNARQRPDKIALIQDNRSMSYMELYVQSRKMAILMMNCGVRKQDRVFIFMDNSIDSVVAMYATMIAGSIFVIPNATMKERKLAYLIQDAEPKTIVANTAKAPVVCDALKRFPHVDNIIWCGNKPLSTDLEEVLVCLRVTSHSFERTILEITSLNEAVFPQPLEIDLATIIYTSGSTGKPKGVMTTHYNMISAAASIITYLENREDDVLLCALPLSFDYGLYQVIMTNIFGGTVVLEKSFVYLVRILDNIAKYNITGFPVVPTVLSLLFETSDAKRFPFQTLRYITSTAAPLSPSHIKQFRSNWPHVTIYSMYGLTECKRVAYVPPKDLSRKIDSVGIPMPGVEAYVVNSKGELVKPGQIGELVVRGPNVMQGYWRAPEETAKKFVTGDYPADIRLFTGDLFMKDEDGFLFFLSRKDDLIKTKGERVSPKEIENILCEIEGVSDAAVIGVPDKIIGEAIHAYVVCNSKNISKMHILAFCKINLEPFMIPRKIIFVAKLPLSPNGKVDKKKLIIN